jgi:alkylation response protein AidB-like acyl-CoA dehydrogenase
LSADVVLVFARTDASVSKAKGISAFLVDGSTAGFTRSKPEDKLGLRSSETVGLFFDNARLGAGQVLGELGKGFSYAMSTLDAGRIGIATQAVGIAQAAVDVVLAETSAGSQAIEFRLADMAARADAARLLVWRAAALKDAGQAHSTEASLAKLFASEAANRNCRDALEVLGPAAYGRSVAERLFRDARVTEIYEGTSEVQRLVSARGLRGG